MPRLVSKEKLEYAKLLVEKNGANLVEDSVLKNIKLGQLENIEEKIGCPLVVFFQIFKKGIWVKSDCTKNKIEHWHAQDIKVIDAGWQWDICKIRTTCNKYVGCFNYGKTWALTKEELAND